MAAPARTPDTRDMLIVHRSFRREMGLLPDLVAAVPEGDTRRARELAEHIRDCALGLHFHHTGEDELLWPKLLARVDLEADLVLRMEAQHTAIAECFRQADGLLPAWEAAAAGQTRDRLAAVLTECRLLLLEHLDDEETHILPLVEKHLTVCEWEALGDHFGEGVPQDKRLFFLGALLEEATGEERALMLGKLPLPARVIWYLYGRGAYRRRVARIRTPLRRSTARGT